MSKWAVFLAGLVLACGSEDQAGSGARDAASGCNGHPELCERRLDQVVFPATHNSMSNAEEGWLAPNQLFPISKQLDDGVRALLIDTHYDANGEPALCHSSCNFGQTPLVDALSAIAQFLAAHPREVLVFILEDYVSVPDTEAAFRDSGLIDTVYAHPAGADWPTLAELVDGNERLVVTAQNGSPPPAWYHNVWDVAFDTPYSFTDVSEFSCAENRGSRTNDLFLLNHWLENPLPSQGLSEIANEKATLLGRARRCEAETGKLPNFVAVNHYSIGALFEAAAELNGVSPPERKP